jgi:hypothetical protein
MEQKEPDRSMVCLPPPGEFDRIIAEDTKTFTTLARTANIKAETRVTGER